MERKNKDELTTDDIQKNLLWKVVGPRGARRLVKMDAMDWPMGNTRGRGRSLPERTPARGAARSAARIRLGTPVVPQPAGRGQPAIKPVALLPPPDQQAMSKRTRDRVTAAAAGETTMVADELDMVSDEEEMEDETRSPASKR
jgi:hypothetical protein